MKRYLLVLAAHGTMLGAGTDPFVSDSASTVPMPEVVITATRSPIARDESPSPVQVLGPEELNAANGTTVAEVLESSGGLLIRDYGGRGALKSLSLRGTPSQHILVLLDGSRLNSFQNGSVDLGLVAATGVERIEIVRGGSSALYGADALGGVMDIRTRTAGSGRGMRTEISAGSSGFQRFLAEAHGEAGPASFLAGVGRERGRDDFPFRSAGPSGGELTLQRDNADFLQNLAYLRGDIRFKGGAALSLSGRAVEEDRGLPGRFQQPAAPSGERQGDTQAQAQIRYEGAPAPGLDLSAAASFNYSLERYINPLYAFDSHYKNRFAAVNPQARWSVAPGHALMAGIEFAEGTLDGNDFDGRITRVQRSVYVSSESHISFGGGALDRLSVYPSIRADDISDVGASVTSRLGVNLRVLREGNVRLRSSAGGNYHAPSFNDLYYAGFSNPLLKAERSTGFDAGVSADIGSSGGHSLAVTWFSVKTEDRIDVDQSTFLPVNLGLVRSTGVEASYAGELLPDLVSLRATATFTDARKQNGAPATDPSADRQVIYTPRSMASASVTVRPGPLAFTITGHAEGERFVSQYTNETLPPYKTASASCSVRSRFGGVQTDWKLEVNNVFGAGYELVRLYPMPLRTFRVTLGAAW